MPPLTGCKFCGHPHNRHELKDGTRGAGKCQVSVYKFPISAKTRTYCRCGRDFGHVG